MLTQFHLRPRLLKSFAARSSGSRGFTLIELLTVISIIAILATLTFAAITGVREKANISKAKVELAGLATALESYKRQYGDYPRTGDFQQESPTVIDGVLIEASKAQSKFFNAMAGKLGPKMDAINGKVWIDLGQYRVESESLPETSNTTEVANAFLDPWGRRYLYYYKPKTGGQWTSSSYVLYSVGPRSDDKVQDLPPTATGIVNYDDANNVKNIYANK